MDEDILVDTHCTVSDSARRYKLASVRLRGRYEVFANRNLISESRCEQLPDDFELQPSEPSVSRSSCE